MTGSGGPPTGEVCPDGGRERGNRVGAANTSPITRRTASLRGRRYCSPPGTGVIVRPTRSDGPGIWEMSVYEPSLGFPLDRVAHCRNDKVDMVVAKHRNSVGWLHLDELDIETEPLGDLLDDGDFVAASLGPCGRPKKWVVVTDAGTDMSDAKSLDQPIGVRLGTGSRDC